VIATATVAPLANVDTLGRPIVSPNVYGTAGQLAACIVVALLTFAADALLAAVQRAVTPRGIKIQANPGRSRGRLSLSSPKRSVQST
jgi:osmoprotectant transport system permease protein